MHCLIQIMSTYQFHNVFWKEETRCTKSPWNIQGIFQSNAVSLQRRLSSKFKNKHKTYYIILYSIILYYIILYYIVWYDMIWYYIIFMLYYVIYILYLYYSNMFQKWRNRNGEFEIWHWLNWSATMMKLKPQVGVDGWWFRHILIVNWEC